MNQSRNAEAVHADIEEVLFTQDQIRDTVATMARSIAKEFEGDRPLVVGILNGCFAFLADLVRAMDIPLEVDFMAVSSYGGGTKSSGIVRTIKDLNQTIEGRRVLLVEDIIDTGLTLRYLVENLTTRHPASLDVCALLDKAQARTESVEVRWTGLKCPEKFVVGYGLDYAGLYRNLPYIGVLSPQVYRGS